MSAAVNVADDLRDERTKGLSQTLQVSEWTCLRVLCTVGSALDAARSLKRGETAGERRYSHCGTYNLADLYCLAFSPSGESSLASLSVSFLAH